MIITALFAYAAATQMVQIPTTYLPLKPTPETVLARVDGVPIKASDVERLLWDWRGYEVTQDLISYQLIHEQASKLKIVATPADIQKEYEKFVAEQKKTLPAGQDFDSVLKQQHLPKSRLYMQVETNFLLSKIVSAKFDPTKFVKIATLVFKPKTEAASDLAESVGKATDAYNRLTKGEDWEKVMNSSGQEAVLIQNKGLLGWRNIDAFPAFTQAELKTAKVGSFTKPVQTQNGLQLFQIKGIGSQATGSDLTELKAIYEQSAKQTFLQNLQKTAKIERLYEQTPKAK